MSLESRRETACEGRAVRVGGESLRFSPQERNAPGQAQSAGEEGRFFIVEHGSRVRECRIVSERSGLCVLRFADGSGCALRRNRLYRSRQEAGRHLRRTITSCGQERQVTGVIRERTPWSWL